MIFEGSTHIVDRIAGSGDVPVSPGRMTTDLDRSASVLIPYCRPTTSKSVRSKTLENTDGTYVCDILCLKLQLTV